MLILEPSEGALTVLPTHRVVLGLDAPAIDGLLARLPDLFDVQTGVSRDQLIAAFDGSAGSRGGEGRFGLWTPRGGAVIRARRSSFVPWLPQGGNAVRRLDVTLASVAIERLAGIDPAAVAEGSIAFTMDAREALSWVDDGHRPLCHSSLMARSPSRV
jgi:hypothetical protein